MQTDQEQQLRRVASAIGPLVLAFCRDRLSAGAPRFRMAELGSYVTFCSRDRVAPDSPSRILRQLARAGLVRYRVVNRAQSLYELEQVSAA